MPNTMRRNCAGRVGCGKRKTEDLIETLQTDRLVLRGWTLADFEPLADFLADEELCKHRGGAIGRIEASNFMSMLVGQWVLRGYGGYAIEKRSLKKVIGMTGLWHPYDFTEPELFWSIFRGYHGKGFATEAASAVRDWAIEVKELSVMSFVSPENTPSIKLAERLGAIRGRRHHPAWSSQALLSPLAATPTLMMCTIPSSPVQSPGDAWSDDYRCRYGPCSK